MIVFLCYSRPMKTETRGFQVTGVAGLESIEIGTVKNGARYVEINVVVVDSDGDPTPDMSFDVEGLEDLIAGLTEALRLARHLAEEMERNSKP